MSDNTSQFINDTIISELKEQEEKERNALKCYDLSHKYFELFKPNFEQGIFMECFVPMFFHYVNGTFNLDWMPI